jgi:hypothetical protein
MYTTDRPYPVTDFVTVPGELAYNCLRSMPFDPRNGTLFVSEITKFVQWQSTLEVLQSKYGALTTTSFSNMQSPYARPAAWLLVSSYGYSRWPQNH